MAISINSAADARYYASRMNSSRTNSSSAAKKSTSSIVSSAARAVAAATSAVKSVVKKNSSSATTTAKKNNTNAAVNAASASVKSKTNQNKKTTTTVSSAASKVASSISKAVKTATNAVKTVAQNTKTATNAKAAAASTTKTASKNTTSSKNTTNAKTAAVNNSNTKKTTSSNNNNLASRIVNTVSTAASTVKKATSNVNTSAAAERARQEAMSKAVSARAEAEAKARAAAATKSTTASAIGVSNTATIKTTKNTALSNKNTGKTTNTTVNPNVAKSASTVKKDTTIITNNISTPKYKSNPQPEPIGIIKNTKISDKDRVTNAVPILAAKNAKIPVDSHGVPIINNGGDAKRYMEELNKIKNKENQIRIAAEAGVEVDVRGNPQFKSETDKKTYENLYESYINKINKTNEIWTQTTGINLTKDKTSLVLCQSTEYSGEYPGWDGCISTSIAAMFRINDGATGAAKDLVNSDTDGSNPTSGKDIYSFKKKGGAENGLGIINKDALELIKIELAQNKVCVVKLDRKESGVSTKYGHTVVCSGIREGVSLTDATWDDLLFNDVGRSSEENRKSKTMSEMPYDNKTYFAPADNNCSVIIDTTGKE